MSRQPVRVQLRRTKGWRMPAETVKIDRTTKWGNPFIVERCGMIDCGDRDDDGQPVLVGPWRCREKAGQLDYADGWYFETLVEAQRKAVALYRFHLQRSALRGAVIDELRWKNLACWCGDEPCHGDVLLAEANRRIKP